MKYLIGIFATLMAITAAAAWAADATGSWKGEVHTPDGRVLPFVAHLKQDNSAITGKLEGINGAPDVEIMEGKIDGDTITFWGIRKVNGADVKFTYSGKLSGDSLDIKILRGDGTGAPLEALTQRVAD